MTTPASEHLSRAETRGLALVPSLPRARAALDDQPGTPPGPAGSMAEITVAVITDDPVSRVGLGVALRELPGLRLLISRAGQLPQGAQVAVVAGETVDPAMCDAIRTLRAGASRVLVCPTTLDDHGLQAAIAAGAGGVLRRCRATPEELGRAVRAVSRGTPVMPGQDRPCAGGTRPQGGPRGTLTSRETTVLAMLADGYDTREIAEQLCYSERTVKNVIHTITSRLQLRNRSHAVAYAVRHQLI